MLIIDRNSISDAEKWVGSLLTKLGAKHEIVAFLSTKIEYADDTDDDNWNLNLDPNGRFLRFNVGQEYCIQITGSELLILCLKSLLPAEIKIGSDALRFRGYDKKTGVVNSIKFSEVPDCLVKVPDSIGVVITNKFEKWLPLLEKSNLKFIEYAISNTKVLPQMIGAHSVGAIDYLSNLTRKKLPNPRFSLGAIQQNENIVLRKLKSLSDEQLSKLTPLEETTPRKTTTKATVYVRNPYIVERAKRLADGKCQDCGQPAPFISKIDNHLYLEVHHIVPLSNGGKDNIENVIALCPNCHRKRHYG